MKSGPASNDIHDWNTCYTTSDLALIHLFLHRTFLYDGFTVSHVVLNPTDAVRIYFLVSAKVSAATEFPLCLCTTPIFYSSPFFTPYSDDTIMGKDVEAGLVKVGAVEAVVSSWPPVTIGLALSSPPSRMEATNGGPSIIHVLKTPLSHVLLVPGASQYSWARACLHAGHTHTSAQIPFHTLCK